MAGFGTFPWYHSWEQKISTANSIHVLNVFWLHWRQKSLLRQSGLWLLKSQIRNSSRWKGRHFNVRFFFKENISWNHCQDIQDKCLNFLFRILYNIMSNDFVEEDYKDRLRTSARIGRDHDQGSCSKKYVCSELDH